MSIRDDIIEFMKKRKKATWSEIKNYLEEKYGEINPNLLAFNLRRLVAEGILKRHEPKNILEDPVFELP